MSKKYAVEFQQLVSSSEMGHSRETIKTVRLTFSSLRAAQEAAAQLPNYRGTAMTATSPTIFSLEVDET